MQNWTTTILGCPTNLCQLVFIINKKIKNPPALESQLLRKKNKKKEPQLLRKKKKKKEYNIASVVENRKNNKSKSRSEHQGTCNINLQKNGLLQEQLQQKNGLLQQQLLN